MNLILQTCRDPRLFQPFMALLGLLAIGLLAVDDSVGQTQFSTSSTTPSSAFPATDSITSRSFFELGAPHDFASILSHAPTTNFGITHFGACGCLGNPGATDRLPSSQFDLPPSQQPLGAWSTALCTHQAEQWVETKQQIGTRTVRVAAQDEVWVVSARNVSIPGCGSDGVGSLQCERLLAGRFVPASLNALTKSHQCDHSKATVVFVHGNLTDLEYAKSRALQAYENLFQVPATIDGDCMLPLATRAPIRYVVFAWKAEAESKRVVQDFLLKSDRSYDLAPAFGHFLDQFPDRRMLLLGYSLGAQIVLRGIPDPLLAQPTPQPIPPIDRTCLPLMRPAVLPTAPKTGRYRVALLVPSLSPRYTRAELLQLPHNSAIQSTTVFVNQTDRAIRIANLILKTRVRGDGTALEQLAEYSLGAINPIRIVDITAETSRCHSITRYTSQSFQLQSIMRNLLWQTSAGLSVQPSQLATRPRHQVLQYPISGHSNGVSSNGVSSNSNSPGGTSSNRAASKPASSVR